MRALSSLALALAFAAALSWPAYAAEDPDERWGIAIWGLSYHINRSVDYDEANVGLGLRYYFNRLFFVEADALRNSNHGLALPVSAGLELKVASLGQPCSLYAMAGGTVVYYQNRRTERDYVKAGPVPGMTLGCGRVKVNGIIVLQPSHQPFSVVAVSLTILIP
jgi:hypothetical protein